MIEIANLYMHLVLVSLYCLILQTFTYDIICNVSQTRTSMKDKYKQYIIYNVTNRLYTLI